MKDLIACGVEMDGDVTIAYHCAGTHTLTATISTDKRHAIDAAWRVHDEMRAKGWEPVSGVEQMRRAGVFRAVLREGKK